MWTILDAAAPDVVACVYERLHEDGWNSTHAAEALHAGVEELRRAIRKSRFSGGRTFHFGP
jgi:hypothetical protein